MWNQIDVLSLLVVVCTVNRYVSQDWDPCP